jgi:hypothetical protein
VQHEQRRFADVDIGAGVDDEDLVLADPDECTGRLPRGDDLGGAHGIDPVRSSRPCRPFGPRGQVRGASTRGEEPTWLKR